MIKHIIVTLLAIVPVAAQAEPIPSYVLDKDYQACMGGETPTQDPQRSQYCDCVRDSMRNWDLETYGNLAMQQSKTPQGSQPPQQIEDIAKACIDHVLH